MVPRGGRLTTKRWNDPREPGDGFRVLVTRYRPRGLPKARETWDAWWPDLAPSRDLLRAFQGKSGPPIPFARFAAAYRDEMKAQRARIDELGARLAAGEALTLMCSSACVDPRRCHRTPLAALVKAAARRAARRR